MGVLFLYIFGVMLNILINKNDKQNEYSIRENVLFHKNCVVVILIQDLSSNQRAPPLFQHQFYLHLQTLELCF
jgi:hypothetical protein